MSGNSTEDHTRPVIQAEKPPFEQALGLRAPGWVSGKTARPPEDLSRCVPTWDGSGAAEPSRQRLAAIDHEGSQRQQEPTDYSVPVWDGTGALHPSQIPPMGNKDEHRPPWKIPVAIASDEVWKSGDPSAPGWPKKTQDDGQPLKPLPPVYDKEAGLWKNNRLPAWTKDANDPKQN